MALKRSKAFLLRPYLYKNDFNSVSKKSLKSILNAIITPAFNVKEEINIAYRITDTELKDLLENNHLLRLKFSNARIFNLEEKEKENFENIQFLIISAKQYSSCLLFDFSLAEKDDEGVFCTYFNSKKIDEILKILLPEEKFPPERRENNELNEAILTLIKNNENSLIELNINEVEKNNLESINQTLKRDEFLAQKSRYISHEIKNQLSIIDIYTKIAEKTYSKDSTIQNVTVMIFNAIKSITKLLQDLKTFSEADLNVYNLNSVITETVSATCEMANANGIKLSAELKEDINVVIDKDKYQNVLLNLIKNAIEALKETDQKDKEIEVSTSVKGNRVSVFIKNNGEKISKENQEKIFEEGFTTKETGSGLGLFICKQNLSEQFCELSLLKSTPSATVFEIKMNKV